MTYHDRCLSWGSWGIQSQPQTGWQGVTFSREKVFLQQQVQAGPEAHPLSYPTETISFPGIKALEHEADQFDLPFLFCNLTDHLFAPFLYWAKWSICWHPFAHHIYLQGNRKKQFKVTCVYDRWDMHKILHLGHTLQYTILRTHVTVHNAQCQKYVASRHYAVNTYSQVKTPNDGG